MSAAKGDPPVDNIGAVPRPASFEEFENQAAEACQLINNASITSGQAEQLAHWAVGQFWGRYLSDGSYLGTAISLLCDMATHPDPAVAATGREAIFSSLVERLSDAFSPQYCVVYDRLFAQITNWSRCQPGGEALHQQLDRFRLHNGDDVLERKRRLDALPAEFHGDAQAVRKIILLSRVTLGADVAVVATLMSSMRDAFPNAEYVLLAAPGVGQMFAGDDRVSLREIRYRREAPLVEQFSPWLQVVHAIRTETEGLQPREFIVVDPDSRLTQLGLLPVTEDESRYFFFPSRSFGSDGSESIAELANLWATQVFGNSGSIYPQLSLSQGDWDFAQAVRRQFARAAASHVVTVNFGVGGNDDKRLSEDFEQQLVLRLLESGSHVVLARGIGPEETARSGRLLKKMEERGKRVLELDVTHSFKGIPEAGLRSDVLAWRGDVGAYCALIGNSDEYIGYDSAGQHIAAALGVPAVDIFAHSPYPLFMQRWRPHGRGIAHVIDATDQKQSERPDFQAVLDQVMGAVQRL